MTIPNLITAHQKKVTVTRLQKAISVLNQAYKLANEELAPPSETITNKEYFKTYWAPYLKAYYCGVYSDCGYKSNRPFSFSQGYPYQAPLLAPGISAFTTLDGFFVSIRDFASEHSFIIVDINGSSLPNKFECDIFFLVKEDDGIYPECKDSPNAYVNAYCRGANDGRCCAERIRRAGWKIDKSYPWK